MDSRKLPLGAGVLMVAASLLTLAGRAVAAEPVAAEWRQHEYLMTYTGVTALYSCDGLESKLKLLLKSAGARADLRVRATCSEPLGRPSRMVTARLQFATLAPVGAPPVAGEKPDPKAAAPVPAAAEWRSVHFAERSPRDLDGGDCELVEQFDRELLAFFTVRNRVEHMTCTPHQVSLGGIELRFDALVAASVAN